MKYLLVLGLLWAQNINTFESKSYDVYGYIIIYQSGDTKLSNTWLIGNNVDISEVENTVNDFCGKGKSFPECKVVENE